MWHFVDYRLHTAKQRANEQKNKLLKQTFWNNHITLNKWMTTLIRWNRILQIILIDFR
jgi:hypothetical protein